MDTGTDAPPNGDAFDTLPLHPGLHASLRHLGYRTMTPIQAASLPLTLAGKDLIAQAKTGSGKMAAFTLPLLTNLNPRRFAVQAHGALPDARTGRPGHQGNPPPGARFMDNIKVLSLVGGTPSARSRQPRAWRPHRRRHARAPSRPSRTRQPEPRCGQHAGARRSRPHARHGLHDDIVTSPGNARCSARRCCSRPPTRRASPNSHSVSSTVRRK